jgi:hypothetical protein
MPEGIVAPAAVGTAVYRRSRDLEEWERGPTRGLSLPLASVALDPASSRPGNGPTAATHEDVLLRLALWLAEVAAEAALAATAAGSAAPRRARRAERPSVAEPAR